MHMDKWNTQSILVILCSTRGTEITKVKGLWLVNSPNCSVSENPDNSPEVRVCSPFIVPSQNSMRDHCDVISQCYNHLLWSSGRKTTAHAHRKHCSLSVHLLVSTSESPVIIDASKLLCLFLNPNSMPLNIYIPPLGLNSHQISLRADEAPVKGMKNVYSYAKLILMQNKDSCMVTERPYG